ncbi:Uncharacterised protein [Bordetella pertussis]|nr:Uncharacterised protein [Bordetella pertussis]
MFCSPQKCAQACVIMMALDGPVVPEVYSR